jgi:hypothetical protein
LVWGCSVARPLMDIPPHIHNFSFSSVLSSDGLIFIDGAEENPNMPSIRLGEGELETEDNPNLLY